MRYIPCCNIYEVANAANHNTRAFVRMVQRANTKITRLEKKSRSFMRMGIIFGVIIELCIMEQNKKIAALHEEVSALNAEFKELRNKEGD